MAGKTDESKWTMVRLRKETHAALREIGAMLQSRYEAGLGQVGDAERGSLSLDAIILELIRRDKDHRRRGKAARKSPKADDGQSEPSVA